MARDTGWHGTGVLDTLSGEAIVRAARSAVDHEGEWIVFYDVVLPLLGMGMGGWVIYGGLRIAHRALDQKHERDLAKLRGSEPGDMAELRDRVARLEDVSLRVQELEERMDFTERVITSGRNDA